jgi:hypothetical protein
MFTRLVEGTAGRTLLSVPCLHSRRRRELATWRRREWRRGTQEWVRHNVREPYGRITGALRLRGAR